jgi:hypothetical protein
MAHGLKHVLEKFLCGAPVSLIHGLGNGELAGSANARKEIELAFSGLRFANVDVKEPDRIAFEFLALRFGLVPLAFRSLNSFKLPFVRTPRGFCRLTTSAVAADCRTR